MKKKVICFGESVFDCYENNKKVIAGAPLHVALKLSSFNFDSYLSSQVGKDDEGSRIIKYLNKKNVNTSLLTRDKKLSTGIASVTVRKSGIFFKLDKYCAWDEIKKLPNFMPDLLYTGSVSSRSSISSNTLKKLLKIKIQNIFFDPNIRQNNYNLKILNELLFNKSTHIKVTNKEINILSKITNNKFSIRNIFKINRKLQFIAVTKGSKGSTIITRKGVTHKIIPKVIKEIHNTVGAGDSFSAGLIIGILLNKNLEETHKLASSLAFKSLRYLGSINLSSKI